MTFADSWFWVTPTLIYLVPVVVITVLAYLVLRFGIRDGLRAHAHWLEHRNPQTRTDTRPEAPSDGR